MLRFLVLLFGVAAVWTAALLVAPLITPSIPAWATYAAAATVCHQLADRSFHLAGAPVAVCARCLGLYAGGVAGFGTALVLQRGPGADGAAAPRRARLLIAALALPTLITLTLEQVARLPMGNFARFATAVPLGAAIAWVIGRAVEADARRPAATEVD